MDNDLGAGSIVGERFFAPIASRLTVFANSHNLRIAKYEHASVAWNFHFRLSDSSTGLIQTLSSGENQLFVAGSRELRDYERFRRYVRRWDGPIVIRDDPELERVLTSLLTEIMELPTSLLECDGRDYETLWQDIPAIQTYTAALPLARIDKPLR